MNPEFLRNLWLELSPQRLLVLPLLIALALGIVHLNASVLGPAAVAGMALALALLLACTWGPRRARLAFTEEARYGTWDTLRMSALSPWRLAWGKLFGATIYVWYAVLICLGVFLWYADPERNGFPVPEIYRPTLGWLIAGVISVAVLTQALAAVSGLITLRFGDGALGSRTVVIAALFWFVLMGPMLAHWGEGASTGDLAVNWWGGRYSAFRFSIASTAAFAAWAVVALWRLVASELRVASRPLAWPPFLAFLAFWVLGFGPPPSLLQVACTVSLMAAAFAYVAAVIEVRDGMLIERLRRLTALGPAHLLLALPASLGALLLALVAALPGLLPGTARIALPALDPSGLWLQHGYAPVVALLAVRDLALLQCFVLGRRPDRAGTNLMVALLLLDALLPLLISVLTPGGNAALLYWLVFPYAGAGTLATAFAALHAALALVALWHVHEGRRRELAALPQA